MSSLAESAAPTNIPKLCTIGWFPFQLPPMLPSWPRVWPIFSSHITAYQAKVKFRSYRILIGKATVGNFHSAFDRHGLSACHRLNIRGRFEKRYDNRASSKDFRITKRLAIFRYYIGSCSKACVCQELPSGSEPIWTRGSSFIPGTGFEVTHLLLKIKPSLFRSHCHAVAFSKVVSSSRLRISLRNLVWEKMSWYDSPTVGVPYFEESLIEASSNLDFQTVALQNSLEVNARMGHFWDWNLIAQEFCSIRKSSAALASATNGT